MTVFYEGLGDIESEAIETLRGEGADDAVLAGIAVLRRSSEFWLDEMSWEETAEKGSSWPWLADGIGAVIGSIGGGVGAVAVGAAASYTAYKVEQIIEK